MQITLHVCTRDVLFNMLFFYDEINIKENSFYLLCRRGDNLFFFSFSLDSDLAETMCTERFKNLSHKMSNKYKTKKKCEYKEIKLHSHCICLFAEFVTYIANLLSVYPCNAVKLTKALDLYFLFYLLQLTLNSHIR